MSETAWLDRLDLSLFEQIDGGGLSSDTTARMLECLSEVPGSDLGKLTTLEVAADQVDPEAPGSTSWSLPAWTWCSLVAPGF